MDLEETRAFLAVIDNGSFKSAAETVRQPRATLRRRVEALEARAGVILLERSRSGVVPTPAGRLLASQGRVMLRETNALLDALRQLDAEPSGDICVAAPAGLPSQALAALSRHFLTELPKLRLHLHVSDEPLGALIDKVDVALHFGREPAGRWHTRTLLTMNEGLRASRAYLQYRGVPRTIADLTRHELLAWRAPDHDPERWPTYDGGTFAVTPALTTTDCNSLRNFARADLGIALLPDSDLTGDGPDQDVLIPVLDGVVGRSRELRAIVPAALADTPKIATVLDHLERFVSELREHVSPRRPTAGAGLLGLHLPAM